MRMMKTVLSFLIAAMLMAMATVFQSCGGPNFTAVKASGNGTGYEGQQPSTGAPVTLAYVYVGLCAVADTPEAIIEASAHAEGISYRLIKDRCRTLDTPQPLTANEVQATDGDLRFDGRIFTLAPSP